MLVNNNTSSPNFRALRLENLYVDGKSKVQKCFSSNHHFLELHKSSISQIDNPYDVVVSLLKNGSKRVKAEVVKSRDGKDSIVLATFYPRKSFLSRADENMAVLKRACDKANSFNSIV